MTTLRTVAEAAPQFRKSTDSMRWWLRQSDCPIRTVSIGRKIFIAQESIDRFFAEALKEAG
jgi:hypothetical protein